jgi:hypothetical protein
MVNKKGLLNKGNTLCRRADGGEGERQAAGEDVVLGFKDGAGGEVGEGRP